MNYIDDALPNTEEIINIQKNLKFEQDNEYSDLTEILEKLIMQKSAFIESNSNSKFDKIIKTTDKNITELTTILRTHELKSKKVELNENSRSEKVEFFKDIPTSNELKSKKVDFPNNDILEYSHQLLFRSNLVEKSKKVDSLYDNRSEKVEFSNEIITPSDFRSKKVENNETNWSKKVENNDTNWPKKVDNENVINPITYRLYENKQISNNNLKKSEKVEFSNYYTFESKKVEMRDKYHTIVLEHKECNSHKKLYNDECDIIRLILLYISIRPHHIYCSKLSSIASDRLSILGLIN